MVGGLLLRAAREGLPLLGRNLMGKKKKKKPDGVRNQLSEERRHSRRKGGLHKGNRRDVSEEEQERGNAADGHWVSQEGEGHVRALVRQGLWVLWGRMEDSK